MARLAGGEEATGGAAGEKGQDEAGHELPFQRGVHWSKAPPIAESAIAYSSLNGSPRSSDLAQLVVSAGARDRDHG